MGEWAPATFIVTVRPLDAAVSALAASSYVITLIPSPDPPFVTVTPKGLNDFGEVVGFVSPGGSAKALLFTGGVLSTFAPDNFSSLAAAVNASGQIAGYGGQFPSAFIFNPMAATQSWELWAASAAEHSGSITRARL